MSAKDSKQLIKLHPETTQGNQRLGSIATAYRKHILCYSVTCDDASSAGEQQGGINNKILRLFTTLNYYVMSDETDNSSKTIRTIYI